MSSVPVPTDRPKSSIFSVKANAACEIFPAIDEEQSNTLPAFSYMQTHGILSRRKEGVRIYYAVKHLEVFEIINRAQAIVKREMSSKMV
jgi:ArsR family transcriptional regulator